MNEKWSTNNVRVLVQNNIISGLVAGESITVARTNNIEATAVARFQGGGTFIINTDTTGIITLNMDLTSEYNSYFQGLADARTIFTFVIENRYNQLEVVRSDHTMINSIPDPAYSESPEEIPARTWTFTSTNIVKKTSNT